MKTVKSIWRHNKFTAFMMVSTTLGWALLIALGWWGLIFIGASLGWILAMLGCTALFFLLFWLIWSEMAKVFN